MKNILIFSGFLFSNTIFGYNNEQIDPIYCPQEIICKASTKSCEIKFVSDTKYFGTLKPFTGSSIDITYKFVSARAPFHSESTGGSCVYISSNPIGYGNIELPIKHESNLEAYYAPKQQSAWVFGGYDSNCESSATVSCPLKERFVLIVHNINITKGVNIKFGEYTYRGVGVNGYSAITDEDVLSICPGVKECTFDIVAGQSPSNPLKYGSIKVDTDTMKILEVVQSYPSKIQITQNGIFNSVDINYPSFKVDNLK